MAMLRTNKCDVCGKEETEKEYASGWKGWGQLHGVVDGQGAEGSLTLCPDDLRPVIELLESRRKG